MKSTTENNQCPMLAIDYKIELAERLFCAMERQSISQAKLARRCNANRAWIHRILNGKENLTIESIAKISLAVDFDLLYNMPIRVGNLKLEGGKWSRQ